MKRCPQCQKLYSENSFGFCLEDGASLVNDETTRFDPQADTLILPENQLVSESALDYAARLNAQMEFKKLFESEVNRLYDEIRRLAESISKQYEKLSIEFGRRYQGGVSMSTEYYLECNGAAIQLSWGCYSQDKAVDAKKIFNPWLKTAVYNNKYYHVEGQDKTYNPCVIQPHEVSWQETEENPKLLTSTQLANECLKSLVLLVAKNDSLKS